MIECVACGYQNPIGVSACIQCTWPFTVDAWAATKRFRIERITIDTNCVNAKHEDDALNTLEKWEKEGKLILQRSDTFLKELKGPPERISKGMSFKQQPSLFTLDVSNLDGDDVLAGPDTQNDLRFILFPTTQNLNNNQANDIEHLRQHVMTGGHAFITKNTNDFIKNGKKEKLWNLGIWVFEPIELIELLRKLYQYT